ncbi:ribose-phosphate pyrophosphokinase [Candidatus Bathyarchaeota archaeon]|nr:ribose-phosphate pyrophosphokinase [Candidatus Bathyarchaeota archaeon]
MIILPGPASQGLANRLANTLRTRLIPVFHKKFPDGENYIRIEGNVQDEEVVLVQTTSPPQDERIMQLFLMADAARSQGAKTIVAAIPYFAYSRQDKAFLQGEAFSAKTVVDLLSKCGVSRIVTVNCHNPRALRSLNMPIYDASAIPVLAEYFRNQDCEGAVSLSMGKKGSSTAEEADSILKGGYDYIMTQRNPHTGEVTVERKPLNVKNRHVIIFDDIISSGRTMAQTVSHVKKEGAEKIYAACVHPLLSTEVRKRIIESGATEVVGTDSVPSFVSAVSVAPVIGRALRREEA